MKIVIFSGGKAPSLNLLKKEIKDADILIAVDSGGNFLRDNGITPNYLVGDFDSINRETLDFFKHSKSIICEYPKDKDFTDTELALELALKLKTDNITFLGCTGTRIDHIIGNIGLLRTCLENNVLGKIKDDNNTIFLSEKPIRISGKKGTNFSLQAFCSEVTNLTIKGAKYPLKNHKLKIGDPITISNEFLDQDVDILFTDGLLMILYSWD